MNIVNVLPYSKVSCAVVGNTKPYSRYLKYGASGNEDDTSIGSWNSSLTVDGMRTPGWIYSSKKYGTIVDQLVRDINNGTIKPDAEEKKKGPIVSSELFLALVTRVEKLEEEIKRLQTPVNTKSIEMKMNKIEMKNGRTGKASDDSNETSEESETSEDDTAIKHVPLRKKK